MIIKQYLEKIKALCTVENSNQTNLDNLAIEISWDNISFYFNIFDLEFKNAQQKDDSEEGILNPEIINQISDCLDLQFISEKETEGNVCFSNSTELRPEFRHSFTSMDLLDYCYAFLHSAINENSEISSTRIPITSDSSVFWKFVKHGSKLQKNSSLR